MAGAWSVGVEMEPAAGKAVQVRGRLSGVREGAGLTHYSSKITPKGLSSNVSSTVHPPGDPEQAVQAFSPGSLILRTKGPATAAPGKCVSPGRGWGGRWGAALAPGSGSGVGGLGLISDTTPSHWCLLPPPPPPPGSNFHGS